MIQGWYKIKFSSGVEQMAYSCTACATETVFGNGEPLKAFCCGKWIEYTQPSGWAAFMSEKLPVLKTVAIQRAVVLPGMNVDYSLGAEEEENALGFG
jgi:hypothetical protein